jgi:hypothetical protein
MDNHINRGRPPTQRDFAKAFLSKTLKDGDLAAIEIFDKAKQQGISIRTLKRAKARLGVISIQEGRIWYWVL